MRSEVAHFMIEKGREAKQKYLPTSYCASHNSLLLSSSPFFFLCNTLLFIYSLFLSSFFVLFSCSPFFVFPLLVSFFFSLLSFPLSFFPPLMPPPPPPSTCSLLSSCLSPLLSSVPPFPSLLLSPFLLSFFYPRGLQCARVRPPVPLTFRANIRLPHVGAGKSEGGTHVVFVLGEQQDANMHGV
jgi:hypothetical protein